jgi:hypothetical protein
MLALLDEVRQCTLDMDDEMQWDEGGLDDEVLVAMPLDSVVQDSLEKSLGGASVLQTTHGPQTRSRPERSHKASSSVRYHPYASRGGSSGHQQPVGLNILLAARGNAIAHNDKVGQLAAVKEAFSITKGKCVVCWAICGGLRDREHVPFKECTVDKEVFSHALGWLDLKKRYTLPNNNQYCFTCGLPIGKDGITEHGRKFGRGACPAQDWTVHLLWTLVHDQMAWEAAREVFTDMPVWREWYEMEDEVVQWISKSERFGEWVNGLRLVGWLCTQLLSRDKVGTRIELNCM